MKNIFLLFFFFFISNLMWAQPFQTGHVTLTVTDVSRNRSIPLEIYYPADIAGNNVPVTTATNSRFPVLGFGHGFVMTWDAYENIWEALVPYGYIIVFPKTEGSLAPSHLEFAKDLAFVISELTTLGQDTASFLYNRVDTMNCVMGHSMGGGSALIAAQLDPAINTIAVMAPAETNPSAIQAATGIAVPALIFSGGNDCVTPPGTNQVPMYDSLQSACKTYISILGGSHCQMAESNFLCSFGEATCSPSPTITRNEQHVVLNRYLIPWLEFQLKGDCQAGAQFDSLITTDTSIVYQKTCLLCNTVSLPDPNASLQVDIFPNPFREKLLVQFRDPGARVTFEMYSIHGKKVYFRELEGVRPNEKIELNLDKQLQEGIYVLKIQLDGKEFVSKLFRY